MRITAEVLVVALGDSRTGNAVVSVDLKVRAGRDKRDTIEAGGTKRDRMALDGELIGSALPI
jgi:hypothetical protein